MWLALSAVPAALLIGITTDISTDIAAVPLLWIGPLVVYLATLILAYAPSRSDRCAGRRHRLIPLALAVALLKLGVRHAVPRRIHRIAPRDAGGRRADLARSTRGGASGARPPDGVHAVRGDRRRDRWRGRGHRRAPRLRRPDRGAAVLAAAVVLATPQGWSRVLAVPAVVGLGIAVAGTIVGPPGTIRVDRSFYGVYRVAAPSPDLHILYSGTTIHGREAFAGPYAGEPLSYYHRAGPLGEVIPDRGGSSDPADRRRGPRSRRHRRVRAGGRQLSVLRDRSDGRFDRPGPRQLHVPRRFGGHDRCRCRRRAARSRGDAGRRLRPARARRLLLGRGSRPPADGRVAGDLDADGRTRWRHRRPHLEPVPRSRADRRRRRARERPGVDHRQRPASRGAHRPRRPVPMGHRGAFLADLADLVEGDRWRTAHADGRRPWTDRYSDRSARSGDEAPLPTPNSARGRWCFTIVHEPPPGAGRASTFSIFSSELVHLPDASVRIPVSSLSIPRPDRSPRAHVVDVGPPPTTPPDPSWCGLSDSLRDGPISDQPTRGGLTLDRPDIALSSGDLQSA